MIKTEDEISIVCHSSIRLNSEKSETGWSCINPFTHNVALTNGDQLILAAICIVHMFGMLNQFL